MIEKIDESSCNGCEICFDSCPSDVIRIDETKNIAIIKYPEDCIGCFECELNCPCDAIYVHPSKEKFASITT